MLPYVINAFENASPLEWESTVDTVTLKPLYDHERGTGNRQLTHWHVRICAPRQSQLTLVIPPGENIYGGERMNAFAPRVASVFSVDGITWTPFFFEQGANGSLAARIVMPADEVAIARVHPYTTTDLESLTRRIKGTSFASVDIIGKTVEGCDLEMITLGGGAKNSVLVRGRAHPWESGGNWFIEGIVDGVFSMPEILSFLTINIMPMACKDGVIGGRTRFNSLGYDLNRGFLKGKPFTEATVPENLALILWLDKKKAEGRLPVFAMDIHDDDCGNLHVGEIGSDAGFAARMKTLETLMRKYTYFTEKVVQGASGGTFGQGLRDLYGVDSVILELNTNRLAAINAVPTGTAWREYGKRFAMMLPEFLEAKR